jgi:hypothetical protein
MKLPANARAYKKADGAAHDIREITKPVFSATILRDKTNINSRTADPCRRLRVSLENNGHATTRGAGIALRRRRTCRLFTMALEALLLLRMLSSVTRLPAAYRRKPNRPIVSKLLKFHEIPGTAVRLPPFRRPIP